MSKPNQYYVISSSICLDKEWVDEWMKDNNTSDVEEALLSLADEFNFNEPPFSVSGPLDASSDHE